MMDNQRHYSNLIKEVLQEAGSFYCLDQLKEHFSAAINSRRALCRVNSLACIIRLLEERDILNSQNIVYLQQLGSLLQSNKIEELVQSYKKFYLDEIEELCICGVQNTFQPESTQMSQQHQNQCLTQNSNHISADLTEALKNISQQIGKAWPYLAMELGIRGNQRDRISAEYPKNYELQAKEALSIWLRKEKENASIEILVSALNARHCARHGLGSFLLEPN